MQSVATKVHTDSILKTISIFIEVRCDINSTVMPKYVQQTDCVEVSDRHSASDLQQLAAVHPSPERRIRVPKRGVKQLSLIMLCQPEIHTT